jgi:hypothetical protein
LQESFLSLVKSHDGRSFRCGVLSGFIQFAEEAIDRLRHPLVSTFRTSERGFSLIYKALVVWTFSHADRAQAPDFRHRSFYSHRISDSQTVGDRLSVATVLTTDICIFVGRLDTWLVGIVGAGQDSGA